MSKKSKKKAKGLSPQEIQRMNRQNIDYQMRVMPMLKFEDMLGNSNQMFSGLMGNAVPLLQGMIDMGNANNADNPMLKKARKDMSAFGGQQAPATPSLTDILAQLQPQQPAQPAQPAPPPTQPQQPPNPYNLTPEQLAAVERYRGGRGGAF